MLLAAVAFVLVNPPIYVSALRGNDRNDGLTRERPIRTLEHALEMARQGDYFYVEGRFVLKAPLIISKSNVSFAGLGHGAEITGATEMTDWRVDGYNDRAVWSAPVPAGLEPREMFVGDDMQRAERPRLPATGFYRFAGLTEGAMNAPWNQGQAEAYFRPADVPPMRHPKDVEVVAHHFWVTSRLPIESIDPSQHLFHFTKKSVFRLSDDYTGQPAPYYLDNVGEALREPGQWYWDRVAGKVFYVPRPKDDLKRFTAWVPALTNLVRIEDAEGVRISNIDFTGCEYDLPADSAGDGQAAISIPGAVVLHNAVSCQINCRVHACGTYGIEVTGNSNGNTITGDFEDLGAGGVKLGAGTSYSTVTNCRIVNDDRIHASGVGVWIGDSAHNNVTHNLISHLSYTGISVGWTWGYGPSAAVDNTIEWNEIGDIGLHLLSDMGGIYTLGVSPGTVIAHNHIRNVDSYGYGGWGIYLDEGSSNVLVQDNIVEHCKTGSFHQHYGRDNLVQNNIFAFAASEGQIIRSRHEDHNSFDMERNLVVWDKTPLFGGDLTGPGFVFRDNVLCRYDGRSDSPIWKGFRNSRLSADDIPGARERDYRFRPGFDGRDLGFQPFDLKGAGPTTGH